MLQKWKVSYVEDRQRQQDIVVILKNVWFVSSRQNFMNKLKLSCFFTSNTAELTKKLTFFTQQEEYLNNIINKFQVLYTCDLNHFRNTSRNVMRILFSDNSNPNLIKKYFSQVERLYEELFRFKIKEILIQYNEQEHKLIPILNNREAVRYMLSRDNADVRRICDQGAHPDHIFDGV